MNLHIKNLSIWYSTNKIIDDFSYVFSPNKTYILNGVNGSGKSTLLKTIVSSNPEIQHTGIISSEFSNNNLRSYVPDQCYFYPDFTVHEFFKLTCYLKKIDVDHFYKMCSEYFLFSDFIHQKMGNLSLGQAKKTFLSVALFTNSKIIILDEPFNGLDKISTQSLIKLINKHCTQHGSLTLMTVHEKHHQDQLSDSAIIDLNNKKINSKCSS